MTFWICMIVLVHLLLLVGLPSVDQNERLRRYERQHQKWLRSK
jgi:hypothetical protein